MPFALLIVGLVLIVTGANDTYKQFGKLLVGDFTGPGNFTYWVLAFGALGALGYNETLRPFSRAFMLLIFVGLIVKNGGFFDKFGQAINQGPSANTTTASASINLDNAAATLKQVSASMGTVSNLVSLAAVV